MTEEEKIKQVLYQFEDGGLVSKDLNKVLSCLYDMIIGIGIGEQGFVTSKGDIKRVFHEGVKDNEDVMHFLDYERIELRIPADNVAVLCADIIVTAKHGSEVIRSRFSQSLTLLRECEDWKICALHASAPVITEENIEAYPLKFAEKTLKSLKEKIGEEVYAVEEQYRMAVLLDTIAFYIINFTTDTYEKCQLNSSICAYTKPGSRYECFNREQISAYVVAEDIEMYLERFSLQNIFKAFEQNEKEVKCEYRMWTEYGKSFIWVVTVIRLITDIVTGEKKGIMYVKNIDSSKRQRIAMQERAEYDEMLKIYNRTAFIRHVDSCLEMGKGTFVMLDIDNFKAINDNCGHPFGDKVLIRMAEILKGIFLPRAILGRLGGDEFGIFLPDSSSVEQMQEYMKALYAQMDEFTVQGGLRSNISCSAGIVFSDGSKVFGELYQDADDALYQSKQNGKHCFSFYESCI